MSEETTTNSRTGIGGPKTEAGKRVSSMNALKHGFRAKSFVAHETIEERIGISYDDLLTDMCNHYHPADPVEDALVQRIARSVWRLGVSRTMEKDILDASPDTRKPNETYQMILHYERQVDITLHRAIRTLMRKRELDRALK